MGTILIAYERDSESNVLSELLSGRGHRVVRAPNGIEALELARREPPDLVLSDILLPKMDGFALCRKWKQDERLQSIPFIFFTTRHDDPKYERFAEELNADRFLARPSEPDALITAVDELLARSKSAGTGTERLPVLNEANVRLSAQVLELQAHNRQLLESEAAYRKLFETSPCPHWVTDGESQRPLLVNDSALELLGYTRDEFLALAPVALEGQTPPSGFPRGVEAVRRKDGSTLAVLRDTRVNDFRGKPAQASVACDLTEHAEAMARLEEESATRKALFESMPDGLLLADAAGHVLEANKAYCRMTGYSKADLLTCSLAELEAVPDGDGARKQDNGAPFRYTTKHRQKSGATIDVEVTTCGLQGKAQLRAAFVRAVTPRYEDVVQRRLAALGELRQASDELEEPALMGRSVESAAAIFGSPVAALLGVQPEEKQLLLLARFASGRTFAEAVEGRHIPIGKTGILAEAVKTGLASIANGPRKTTIDGLPDLERCILMPLKEGEAVRALLVVANGTHAYSDNDKQELSLFADGLWRLLKSKREQQTMKRELQRADIAMESMVAVLSRMIEIHDPHTAGSASRVAELAVALARELGLDGKRQHILRIAALLHDIGSVFIPATILGKPQDLTEHEMALIRTHPEAAKSLLASIDFNAPVAGIIEQHHERFDGSGYPRSLKGEAILLEARILAVADVVEAMCSKRAERPALGQDAALAELESNAGKLYDPRVVTSCIRLFRQHGFVLPG